MKKSIVSLGLFALALTCALSLALPQNALAHCGKKHGEELMTTQKTDGNNKEAATAKEQAQEENPTKTPSPQTKK